MEVAQDLILKPPGSLLVWSSEVQSTTVTLQTLLVVVAVLVQVAGLRLCRSLVHSSYLQKSVVCLLNLDDGKIFRLFPV